MIVTPPGFRQSGLPSGKYTASPMPMPCVGDAGPGWLCGPRLTPVVGRAIRAVCTSGSRGTAECAHLQPVLSIVTIGKSGDWEACPG